MRILSYKDRYTPAELARTSLVEQLPEPDTPSCPKCHDKTYVKPHFFGYIEVEPILIIDGEPELLEERGAPYGATYKGYDWDCPRCLIIFC